MKKIDIANTTAAILAGGQGTRLRRVVSDRPKGLAEIGGRPFLSYLLDQLINAGTRSVVLCIGYRGDQIRKTFGNSYGSLKIIYSQESSPLGTAGAIRQALPLFHSDPLLLLNGDSFCDVDFKSFFSWHEGIKANGSIVLARQSNTRNSGRVEIDPHGRIIRFEEKGNHIGPGWINAGVYLLNHRLLRSIPARAPLSLEQAIFPKWIPQELYGYPCEGRFLDIGTREAYAKAPDFFSVHS